MSESHHRQEQKEPYIGSVRFFKNIILAIVIIMILIPTIFAFVYKGKYNKLLAERNSEASEAVRTETTEPDEPEQETALTRTVTVTDENGNEVKLELAANVPADTTDLDQHAAVTESIEYQQLYPDMYAPQELKATDRQEASIYLTFDGVLSGVTDELITLLAEKNVKATFFVQGEPVGESAMRMEAMASHGHTIGMMGCSREYDTVYSSVEAYLDDLYQQFSEIKSATGIIPTAVRLPGGSVNSYNTATYKQIIAELLRRGFVPYDWTVSGGDDAGEAVSADDIAVKVITTCENYSRAVVQLHDGEECVNTVEAANMIINTLQNEGYTFRAIEPDTMPVLFSYPDYKENIVYED